MFAVHLTAEWAAWVAALAAPLQRRCAWRRAHVVAGILTASGRRTASSWWRAAGSGTAFRSYYYFLDTLGRKAAEVATVLLGLVLGRIDPGGPRLLVIDDTPTKRYGPEVQGAGIHHNPAPGPAGSKFLCGHSWVVLGRVVHHHHGGAVGLPLLGRLSIRDKDIPDLPDDIERTSRTKPQLAAESIGWAGDRLGGPGRRPGVAVDGA